MGTGGDWWGRWAGRGWWGLVAVLTNLPSGLHDSVQNTAHIDYMYLPYHTVHTSYCTYIILYIHHTVHTSYCTYIILYIHHTVHTSYCTYIILYIHHTVHTSYCTYIILYIHHTVHTSYCTYIIPFSVNRQFVIWFKNNHFHVLILQIYPKCLKCENKTY